RSARTGASSRPRGAPARVAVTSRGRGHTSAIRPGLRPGEHRVKGNFMSLRAPRSHRRTRSGAALLLAASLLATSCGGSKSGAEGSTSASQSNEGLGLTAEAGESGLDEAGDPQRGGKLIYGVEAESNAGYCLSEAQLAISGMLVVRAFYDTLTVPNADGGYSP